LAEHERTLREISARITALRDPDEVLQRVVNTATVVMAEHDVHVVRTVATRVTDSLPCPPEAADVGSVGLPGTGVGTVDDQAVSGSDGCEDAGLTVTNGA